MHQNAPKCTTNNDLEQVLQGLSLDQIRFVIARTETNSDAEAARKLGISRSTVAHWPSDAKDAIAQALHYMVADGLVTALHLRRRNLAKAMAVKVAGLETDDERLRQNVATEIIEWELGKATQRNEDKTEGELVIRVERVPYGNKDYTATDTAPSTEADSA